MRHSTTGPKTLPHDDGVTATMLLLLTVLVADARGQQLLEVDGVELRSEVYFLQSVGGNREKLWRCRAGLRCPV